MTKENNSEQLSIPGKLKEVYAYHTEVGNLNLKAIDLAESASQQKFYLDELKTFRDKIQQKPDYDQYAAWHTLVGSSPPQTVNKIDFEGEDNVKQFFLSLISRLELIEKNK